MNDLPDHELDVLSQMPGNPLENSKSIHLTAVYLHRSVDFVTLTGSTHYKQGPAIIPSDLAKLLCRHGSAIPLRSYKRTK